MHDKTNNLGFRPGATQTGLYSHRRWLEAGNFGCRKKRNCTIRIAKTKALISFAVTAKLYCTFVFAYADCWFSNAATHMYPLVLLLPCSTVLGLEFFWGDSFDFRNFHKSISLA